MTNAEIERAKELKHKLDIAWKQVHEFTKELRLEGYSVDLCTGIGFRDKIIGFESPDAKIQVTKIEVIEL